MKWLTKFNIRNKTFMFKIQVIDKPRYPTEGITSHVPKSLGHVIFMDYDIFDETRLFEELEALQEQFGLGDFYIFRTREMGWHCICLDICPLNEVFTILVTSSCDIAFKIAPMFQEFRSWVLRTKPKGERDAPQFHEILKSKFFSGERLQSTSHADFIRKHYGIPVKLLNPDNQFFIEQLHYLTANRCDDKDE